MISNIFKPPVFENDDDTFRAKVINGFAWAVIGLLAVAAIPYLTGPAVDFTLAVLAGLIVMMFSALYLLRRRQVNGAGYLIVILGWFGLGFQAYTADGVRDVIIMAYIALSLLASIAINWRTGGVVIATSLIVIWTLALLEANGMVIPRLEGPIAYSRDISLIFVVITILIGLSTTSLRDAIKRVNKSEDSLRISNQSLVELNQTLENRVASRTSELELANQRNERRAKQFEAIAQVARAATLNQGLETLLPNLAELVSHQFGFYHVGIFLLDEERNFAELRAANSEGGKRLLARGHKLAVGQSGMVGYVSAAGRPRIALDVGDDAAFFNNPDLPNTRSEMALPLRLGDEVIGVLDAQSLDSNAFGEEDIEVLSTLADQVAIAIQNARSYEATQNLLRQAQSTSGSMVTESWKVLQDQTANVIGYQVMDNRTKPLGERLESESVRQAVASKKTIKANGKQASLAVPIRLREQVIGILDIKVTEEHEWDADEVDVVEAVAERLSLALESALLLKATQRRAEIERITSDISSKIGATTQFESILRTAAEELSRVLGGSEVLVQLREDALESEANLTARTERA